MKELRTNTEIPLCISLNDNGIVSHLSCGQLRMDAYPMDFEVRDDRAGRFFHGCNATGKWMPDGTREFHWEEADFYVRESWHLENDDSVVWRMTVHLIPGREYRSVSICRRFSYPENPYGLMAWSANERFPTGIQYIAGLQLFYGDVCYGTLIPAISLYSTKVNGGLTLGTRLGTSRGGRLSFQFLDYHSEGVDVRFSDLLLSDTRNAEAELLLSAHENCYRCALAYWKKKFPAFFEAPNPELARTKGPFLMTNPSLSEEYIRETGKKYAPAFCEVHNHFPQYGEYVPPTETWHSVIEHDYPDAPKPPLMSREKIRSFLRTLQENGIRPMLYLQCTGDVFIPYAEKYFPDSIARDSAGLPMLTWKNCCFASAAKGTRFRAHIEQQIRECFSSYPEIGGVFLDQLCYQALDYAHADGRSAHDNRLVSLFGDSYFETMAMIADQLHQTGKFLLANGPYSIEVAKLADEIMSEGSSSSARSFQYLTIGSRGLLVFCYAKKPQAVEQMFRHVFVCGGTYSVGGISSLPEEPPVPESIRMLFSLCGPLADLLTGCLWILEKAPFTLPEGYEGNLFLLPNGNYALTIISKQDSLLRGERAFDAAFPVSVQFSGVKRIDKVSAHGIMNTDELTFVKEPDKLNCEVKNHKVFSILILHSEK